MMFKRPWRYAGVVAGAALALAACGSPDDDDGGPGPGPDPTVDTTPLNEELELPFDGEVPDMVVGKDGSLHILFRVTRGNTAKLFYSRKAPLSNDWLAPVEVPGSGNAAWRWFCWPDIAVGPDGRVHIVWSPEPSGTNGFFYTSCKTCDGTDWRGRVDGSGNQFTKMNDDLVEFMEIGVTEDNRVHVVTTQLNRFNGQQREQDDQMVYTYSLNGGENWEKNTYITKPQAYEDLNMTAVGNDLHLLMRFKQVAYARYSGGSWTVSQGVPHAGPNLSEINPFFKDGVLTGMVYTSWEYRDPLGVHYTKLGGEAQHKTISEKMDWRYRPNNTMAGEDSRGKRAAVWADFHGYWHFANFDGTEWTADKPFTEAVKARDLTNGLSKGAIYGYSPGHGWQGKILWPISATGQYKGEWHFLFRSPRAQAENGSTKEGKFHYIRYQPFGPIEEGTGTN